MVKCVGYVDDPLIFVKEKSRLKLEQWGIECMRIVNA